MRAPLRPALLLSVLALAACGGGSGDPGTSTQSYTISGTLTGLAAGAQVVLENNGADALMLQSDGAFSFSNTVAFDGKYAVTIATQPVGATCTVQQGTGAGVTANVTNIAVACSANSFAISGTLSGLANNERVTLENNGQDPLILLQNGSFTFSTPVAESGAYNVTVGTQPAGQVCSVTNGQGTHVSGNVANVTVMCSNDTYTVGGMLSGLASGEQVTLRNNGADPLTVTANGSFTFAAPVTDGSAYSVSVGTQPQAQSCVVSNGSGSSASANVSTVSINCSWSSVSFTTPGSHTWTVPSGITSLSIVAIGGGGGGGGAYGGPSNPGNAGGSGAMVTSSLTVTAGQVLTLVVGGGGLAGANDPNILGADTATGGGGGGSSNVDAGSAHQIIAAGGGGGGAYGGTVGGDGGQPGGAGGFGGPGASDIGGGGGAGGTGGAGATTIMGAVGVDGGNGNGGPGGNGAASEIGGAPGGAGGSSVGTGAGGSAPPSQLDRSGGGGGGYGGGGGGILGGGGGAGGSTGPAGTTYASANNAGSFATNGSDGSIVITIQ